MRLGTRQECVGSSPRVSGACQDGAREFARRRPRLTGRLSGVAEKLVGSWEGLEVDVFGIEKLARNMSGDRWRKTVRLTAVESEGDSSKGSGSSLGTCREIIDGKTVRLVAIDSGGCRIAVVNRRLPGFRVADDG
ncbi:hypothetical protein B296_00035909 [Ensete ventricosum]|uniref:Uncharacterized protein n=1 Tax=Ensete ventricosum TaxID=4639 RepID=A0A426YRT1_ENSVE|nr:hypothetical protein B296_00035909 [Ensete ventricosum]